MSRTSMQLALIALVSVGMACASPPKETGDTGSPRETGDVGASKDTGVPGTSMATGAASVANEPELGSFKGSDVAYLSAPLEAGDVFAVADSAPGHGGGHAKASVYCYYDKEKKQFVCDFQADSAPGHGGGGHKAASADSAVGHGGGGHKAASADSAVGHGGGGQRAMTADSAPGHGGGPHKVALLMECKEKEPNRLLCTAPVGNR